MRGSVQEPAGEVEDPYAVLWTPPASPFGLLEEELYFDPWKLLIGCLFLNKTSITQVHSVIWKFFEKWPDAYSAQHASLEDLYRMLHPLGFGTKRSQFVKDFSKAYLTTKWRDPAELPGMGRYASDAYFIFCRVEIIAKGLCEGEICLGDVERASAFG